MEILSFSLLFTALLSLALGFFVLLKNAKSNLNITFFVFSMLVAAFTFFLEKSYFAGDTTLALFYGRLLYIGVVLIPPVFLQLTLLIINKTNENKKALYVCYLIQLIFLALIPFPIFINGMRLLKEYSIYAVNPGFLYHFQLLSFFGILIFAFIKAWQKYMDSIGVKKTQIAYFLVGSALGFIGGSFDYLPKYGIFIYPINTYCNLLIALYLLIFAYAIVRYRLMDITIIIRKSLVYSLVIGLFTGLYLLLVFMLSNFIGSLARESNLVITALMIIAFSLGFQPLKEHIQNYIDRLFFKGKYDYQKTLRTLSQAAVTIINLDELLSYITKNIKDTILPQSIHILIYNQYHSCFSQKASPSCELKENSALIEHLKQKKQPLVQEEMQREAETKPELNPIIEDLNQIQASLCVPLFSKNKLIGLLALGNKQSLEIYNDDDINLLATLGNHIATSIENALLHEEAMIAQQKLIQADKLSSIGTMAAGMAHEIKNPLAMIKGLSQLAQTAFNDKDENFFKEFDEIVPRQLDRINILLENLLKFGQPQKARISSCSLNKTIEDSLKLFTHSCKKKNIEIVKDFAPISNIPADSHQLSQVFSNLFLNAIHAMPMGGTLIIRTKPFKDKILIEVSDSGIGIPEANLKNVFDPFFSTKTNGTGLGLAVSYRIIKEHSGTIDVESQINKGTTFRIFLPSK